MALVLADRVKDTTTSTGTGTITLAGAPPVGFQSFTAVGDGNTTYYTISGGSQWEVGIGTYTASGTTLSRDTVLSSSNAGSLVDFSAGTKDVFVTYPAERSVYEDAAGSININITGNAATATSATSATTATNIAGGASGSIPYQSGTGATTFLASGTGVLVNSAGNPSYSMSPSLTQVTVAADPTLALQVATKQYVDTQVSSGIHFHTPVRVENPTNLNATYNNGTAGVGATLTNADTQAALVIDGVTLSVADRVLIYAQTTQTQNGIYVVTDVGSGATNWVLTRSSDADTYVVASANGLGEGSAVFVQQGTTGAGETYNCNTPGTITFGTTNITFVQISSAQIYSAGNGLQLTGTVFSLISPVVTSNGGTGLTSFTTNGAVYATSTSALTTGTLPITSGGTGATTTADARTNIGATTVGGNFFTLTNPSAITFPRINADNTVSALDDATFRTAIGAGTGNGTVTSVSGTGTVNGLTLTGTVTSSGSLTLGGTLSDVSLTTQVTGMLPVANGGTGSAALTANNVLLGNGTNPLQVVAPGTTGNVLTSDGTTWVSSAAAGGAVSYPQNSQSANYTLVLGDAGKQIFHPASDAAFRTFTIPSNSSVAFPIGTVVLFTVENGALPVNVAITSDTLVFGNGTTGTVLVPANQTLMAVKVTATKWMANYFYQTGSPASQSVAVSHDTTPFVTAYPWTGSGYGSKFANPATLPTGGAYSVAFHPSGNAIAVGHLTTPFVTTYPWSSSGFGVKFANPVTLPPSIGAGVAFSPVGNALAVADYTTPFILAYPWSSSGFGTKFTNPATLPTGFGTGVTFSPAGDAIAVAHGTSPFVSVYPWSGSGFGTKFANPATLPGSTCVNVAFSPSGNAIAVAQQGFPYVSAYPWSGSGFGTKFANPATAVSAIPFCVAFSPAGDAVFVGITKGFIASPYVEVYAWSVSGFGAKLSGPADISVGSVQGIDFDATGQYVGFAHQNAGRIAVFPWTIGGGFGSQVSAPATPPTGSGTGIAFTINP